MKDRRYLLVSLLIAGLGTGLISAQDPHAHHKAMADSKVRRSIDAQPVDSLRIPDVSVRDQNGRERRFYSELVQGKVVVMNFIFTTCTTICPPMGAQFAKLQQQLEGRLGKDVFLVSVSVDPVVDTPQRLRAWADLFGRQPGWTLVTGSKPRVDSLLKALRVFTPDKEDHSPIVLVGNDRKGTWLRAYGLAAPDDLARLVDTVRSPEHAGAPGAPR